MSEFTDIRSLIKHRLQPSQAIDYMNTVPLYQNRPKIIKNIGPEPSIRDYYIKKGEQPSINPNAYVKYTKKQDFSKNFKFEEKSKKELLNDLKIGTPNNVNEYIIFTPEYLKPKNRGKPILNNNSIVGGATIPTGPIEKPYDVLTQEEMENRDRQDEILMARLQETGSRLDRKLDESEENANEHMEKMNKLKDIKEKISSKKIQKVVKERIQNKKEEETKNKAAETIQKLARTKLSGVKKATIEEKTPTSKPLEVISEPKPSSITGKDNDGDSDETELGGDDPETQKLFLASIQNYGVPKEDLDKILWRGGGRTRKDQYPMLQKISKELFQRNQSTEFLNKTTDLVSDGKHKIKSVTELNKILNEIKKK